MRKRALLVPALLVVLALAAAACGGSGGGGGGSGEATVTIRVVGDQPEGGLQTIEAKKGDVVHFTVESDVAGEAHVHGYDVEQEVGPGQPAVFDFQATLDGIFEVELHRGTDATQIAKLEVRP